MVGNSSYNNDVGPFNDTLHPRTVDSDSPPAAESSHSPFANSNISSIRAMPHYTTGIQYIGSSFFLLLPLLLFFFTYFSFEVRAKVRVYFNQHLAIRVIL